MYYSINCCLLFVNVIKPTITSSFVKSHFSAIFNFNIEYELHSIVILTQHQNTNKAYGMSRKPKGEGVDLANKALAMTRTRVEFSLLYMSVKTLQEVIIARWEARWEKVVLGLSAPISI